VYAMRLAPLERKRLRIKKQAAPEPAADIHQAGHGACRTEAERASHALPGVDVNCNTPEIAHLMEELVTNRP
jgi:hypothetical protein